MDKLFLANGQVSQNKNIVDSEVNEYKQLLKENFSWFRDVDHVAIADPYTHEIFNETCIRTCFPAPVLTELTGIEYATAHRMFLPESNKSYVFGLSLYDSEQPSWITEEAFVLAEFTKHIEAGRDAPNLEFKELVFVCTDSFAENLGINTANKTLDSFCSAIIVNNEIVATRIYTNPTGDDPLLTNWQSLYVLFCKKAKRIDLARELFSRGLHI